MSTNMTPEYMREWRKSESGQRYLKIQKQKQKAERKAMAALKARHPEEWAMLYRRFCQLEGV